MTASAASPSVPADTALAEFLRGIERRGLVLAEAQCGDHVCAQTAMIATKIALSERAASLQPTQWPPLFWQLLLAQPTLRIPAEPDAEDALLRLGAGPRAALLLRLVAGLDQARGAEALRVSQEAYRQTLSRALDSLRAQGIDEAKLLGMRDRLQGLVRHAPESSRHVAPGPVAMSHDPKAQRQAPRVKRSIKVALRVSLALLLAALATTFFWQPGFLKSHTVSVKGFESLRGQAPAMTLSAATTALSGADFDLLSDPQGERIARDMDLYAWYAANSNADTTSPHPATSLPETTMPETSDPDADATESSSAQ
jgi:hypothetical protein